MYPIINNISKVKIQPIGAAMYLHDEKKNLKSVLQINSTALEILKLCNGKNSLDTIKTKLAIQYNESLDKASKLIDDFVNQSINIKTIIPNMISLEIEKQLEVYGSKDHWSPSVVALELTHNCPLHCKHCYVNAGKGLDMSDDLLDLLYEELLNLNIDTIQLTGGEPLLHPRIIEIITFFTNHNIQVQIMTSGMINNPKINQAISLIKKNNGLVQVSLDGLKDTHNKFRENINSFDNAINFIKELKKLEVIIGVSTCINDQPNDEIESLCKYIKDLGVNIYRIGSITDIGRANENNVFTPSLRVREIEELKKYLCSKFNDDTFSVHLIEEATELQCNDCSTNCGYGHNFIMVNPKGDMYPCLFSEKSIGNYYDSNIKTLMKNKLNSFYNLIMPKKSICNDCEFEPLCHNCINLALLYSKQAKNCYWLKSQKNNLEIAQLI